MPTPDQVSTFIKRLRQQQPGGAVFNPWRDDCALDLAGEGANARRRRLAQHLACKPALLLIGEAPGFQGARYSGIAFTSERLLANEGIPRVERTPRITTREPSFTEPSAAIVWTKLRSLGIDKRVVLWNAFPFHPHLEAEPLKNRTPHDEEITGQAVILHAFLALYPRVPIVAIGNVADGLLGELAGGRRRFKVRHPANGGATAFGTGLDGIAHELGVARPQPTLLD